jgi:riboflavin kinase/FMN adenylyltransferase
MELIRGLHNIRAQHKGCVLTIGKFDGVHLGHQAVLKSLIAKSKALNLPATVMVFEPQPEEVFAPQHAPARLSRWRDKYNELKRLGLDRLICIPFNAKFASQSAQEFIDNILVGALGVQFLVVGDDFRFGYKRKGDFAMLQDAANTKGFAVVNTKSFRLADCRISSTAIRAALADDNFALANEMLGREFAISGNVVHGQKKGRTIGFPTANVNLKRAKAPVKGVFAVHVYHNDQRYDGVANIGARPTVDGRDALLEVHMFDFTGNIYGQKIHVTLQHKLRGIVKFATLADLQAQIQLDAEQARQLLR